jgi:hypothetical protein
MQNVPPGIQTIIEVAAVWPAIPSTINHLAASFLTMLHDTIELRRASIPDLRLIAIECRRCAETGRSAQQLPTRESDPQEPLVATLRISSTSRESGHPRQTVDGAHVNPSRSIFAALRSAVSKPSVNQP